MSRNIFTILTLGVLGYACERPSQTTRNPLTFGDHSNAEFQKMLELSSNALIPSLHSEGNRLNLDSKVVDLTIDNASGSWAWVTFDTQRQERVEKEEGIKEWSYSFIRNNSANLGVEVSELLESEESLVRASVDQIYLTYYRQINNVRVKNAFTQMIFVRMEDGWYLRELINNSFGRIQIETPPIVPLSTDEIRAKTTMDNVVIQKTSPSIVAKLNPNGAYDFHYAMDYVVEIPGTERQYAITLSDRDQSYLQVLSNVNHINQEIKVETYKVSYALKDQYPVPFSFVQIGPNLSANEKGIVDAPNSTATLTLQSTRGRVVDLTANRTNTVPYSFPITFAPNGKTTVTLTQADPAALNGYMGLIEVDRWVRQFLSPNELPLLNTGILSRVNGVGNPRSPQQGGDGFMYCNAYYIPGSLNFFQAGTEPGANLSCGNTALIKDVMYHEWGHALDDQLGIMTDPQFGGKITDRAFSEGIGDINANLASSISGLGLGFFLNDANRVLRDANNAIKHPPTADFAEIHLAGQIISGAFWDLFQYTRTILGPEEAIQLTSKLFYRHLITTDRYVDSYQSVLRLDDNDNNPATPSPNQCIINKAFANHGLTAGMLEPADCTVKDSGIKLRFDTEFSDGTVQVIASSMGAEKLLICEGKVSNCTSSSPGYAEFSSYKEDKVLVQGPKLFFNSPGERSVRLKVDPSKTYTVVSVNKRNLALNPLQPNVKSDVFTAVGAKSFTFSKRDSSADLSKTLK